ncbi:MAG: aminoacyl--tRNA ligase-related protein [Patescibacteria group bacterium]
MRYSTVFAKTEKIDPKDAVIANHKLLVRGGFIDQLMAGSWTLLPMGWRVITKITQVVREEMNNTGAQERLMPLMHPKEIWNETGRWDSASEVMYQLKDSRKKEFALSFTHEEIVMDLIRKHVKSYKDLPVAIYHFSTKFRNEARPQGGILRGREFLMKDLYSAHATEEGMAEYYEKVSEAYIRIFERLGFEVYTTEAAGGVFTDKHTREFQVVAEAGEDTIYVKPGTRQAFNKEVFDGNEAEYEMKRSIEVGNIFPFGDKNYAEKMGGFYTDKDGTRKLVHFASYGIGITRLLGTLVEVNHDDKGIIWPETVAPFAVHLVEINKSAEEIYRKLIGAGIEVLWDETDRGAGEKLGNADLLGIPVRLIVSEKTGDKIEWKRRNSEEKELLDIDEVLKRLQNK